MNQKTGSLAVFALVLTVGCQGEIPVDETEDSTAITNGWIDTLHNGVGRVGFSDSELACAGTLIDSWTVVTAAQCPTGVFVLDQTKYSVDKVILHPDYVPQDFEHDLAIHVLKRPAPGKTIRPLAQAVAPVGTAVTLVGFGDIAYGRPNNGSRRATSSKIVEASPLVYKYGNGVGYGCDGDGGGPTYARLNNVEQLIGVHSALEGECNSHDYDVRIDANIQFIKATQTASHCGGKCGDLNHDGRVDVADLIRARNWVVNGSDSVSRCDFQVADLNRDGKLNISDLTMLQTAITGGGALSCWLGQ